MKSASERAVDIVHEMMGGSRALGRSALLRLSEDDGEMGKLIAKYIDIVGRGIVRDRTDCEKSRSPS